MNVTTILLIPGLWMTALCWQQWVKHYSSMGYTVVARSWPGMEYDVEQLRLETSGFATLGISDIVDHYEQIIRNFETPPIIIGLGVGGLITQILVDRGWGAAGVSIAPAPPKGVLRSVFRNLKLALKGRTLTPGRFHDEFANTLDETASIAAFERFVVPAPKRILLEMAFSNFNSDAASTVRFQNDSRAPLLLVAGGKDRLISPSLVKANFELYRDSKAETDYKEYPNESHFGLTQETKVADYVLGWALCRSNGSKLIAAPNQADTWSVRLST